jgi:hypothetical protein
MIRRNVAKTSAMVIALLVFSIALAVPVVADDPELPDDTGPATHELDDPNMDHVVSCDHNFTWLDVTGDLYWGGATTCIGGAVDWINNQATLFVQNDDFGGWLQVDFVQPPVCFATSSCSARKWLGYEEDPEDHMIEYCHSIYHHSLVSWHCHYAIY